jgi:dephospho-CoA kinase
VIIGLTGGIGTGKSLVAGFLRELGVPVIDTDEIARQVVAVGCPAWRRLSEVFGPECFQADGTLDRAVVAELVFHDPERRHRLESIVHPAIFAEVDRQVCNLQCCGAYSLIVVAVPLLFEVNAPARFDAVVVVTATPDQQRARLAASRGYTPEQTHARMDAQLPLAEKVARADYVIDNSGTPESAHTQVVQLVHRLQRTHCRPGALPPRS